MNRIIVVLLVLLSVVLLLGCQKAANEALEAQIEAESNGQLDVEIESSGALNDWCQAGADWKMSATTEEGQMNAKWTIQGLETTGEMIGLCHVLYIVESEEGNMEVNYYFEEGGENGYMVIEANGQTYKQEWHQNS